MEVELIKPNEVVTYSDLYWGVKVSKINVFRSKLEKIAETNPELGKQLLMDLEHVLIFNIPILRHENGIDFDLETDAGFLVGHGKFLEKLKDVPIEQMDYYLCEVDNQDEQTVK